jgi:tetratricopeptide (TPR) repeat protein
MNKKFESGVKLYHSRRYEQALKDLREAEGEISDSPELDYYIGLALTQLGRFEEALLPLEKVVTSHFSFLHIMQARMVLGYIYAVTGRYRLAEFEFSKVNEIGLHSSQALAALGYVLFCQKKIPESIEALKKALEIDPKNANALNSLGFIYTDMKGKADEAVSLCRQATEINPRNPAYLDSLGWALFQRGNYDEARASLRAALDASPGNKEIASHLRKVLETLKDED